MKTAVEWLEKNAKDRLEKNQHETAYWHYNKLIEDFEKAKEIEKQQIIDAWIDALFGELRKGDDNAEQYYKETYEKQNT